MIAQYFSKYEGAGNDFIIVESTQSDVDPREVRYLCKNHHGIGADGYVLIHPLTDDRWRMIIYNRDGSRASMCGNALRCVAHHLFRAHPQTEAYTIVSDRGSHAIAPATPPLAVEDSHLALHQLKALWWKAHMICNPRTAMDLDLDREQSSSWLAPSSIDYVDFIDTGVPHLIFTTRAPALDMQSFGRFWRLHEKFALEGGVNVSIAKWNVLTSSLELTTYERGVEDLTLACGTGACAAAVSFWSRHPDAENVTVFFKDQLPLLLSYKKNSNFNDPSVFGADISLIGPSRWIFDGKVDSL